MTTWLVRSEEPSDRVAVREFGVHPPILSEDAA